MTRWAMLDNSLPHQIRILGDIGKNAILVYCSCQKAEDEPLLEGRTVNAKDAIATWRSHERAAAGKPDDDPGPDPEA